MKKGTYKKLSAGARNALAAAGFRIKGDRLIDACGGDVSDDPAAQAAFWCVYLVSELGCSTSEKVTREYVALAMEDLKVSISEMQEDLAPGVAF
jgi:hypothetical protein